MIIIFKDKNWCFWCWILKKQGEEVKNKINDKQLLFWWKDERKKKKQDDDENIT